MRTACNALDHLVQFVNAFRWLFPIFFDFVKASNIASLLVIEINKRKFHTYDNLLGLLSKL